MPNNSLDASGTSGFVSDNLSVARLFPAASTKRLGIVIRRQDMKRILLTTLIGILAGAIVGALILGGDQWFRERWQTDSAEIQKWVSMAVFMGASMGAIGGGLIGAVVALAKSRKLPA